METETTQTPAPEEVKKDTPETPAEQQPTQTPPPAEKDTSEEEGDPKQGNLIQSLIGYLKRYNGYPYASISRITSIPKEVVEQSLPLQQIIMANMASGKVKQEDFEKAYVNTDVAIVQLHAAIPYLAKDGLYDHRGPNGYIKSIILPGFFQLSKPEIFEPVIVCRAQGCTASDLGKPGTLGLIKGDPYHLPSPEEIAAAIKETKPEAVEENKPETPAAPEAPTA